MSKETPYAGRFIGFYIFLGVVATALVIGVLYDTFAVSHLQATAVKKSDLGNPNVELIAEKAVVAAAQGQGVTVLSQHVKRDTLSPDGNTETVTLALETDQGPLTLRVTVSKGVWTVSSISVA